MSFNLIETAKSLFTNETERAASTQLGESEMGIKKALGAIIPVIFAGLAQKASSQKGATEVANMAQEQHQGGLLNNLHNLFSADNGNIMQQAGTYVSSLFGNRTKTVTNLISGFSGLKSSSTASLFAAATPFILSVLGRHTTENNVGAQGISSLLASQEHHIQQAMPAELINKNIFGYTDPASSTKKLETITHQQQEIKYESASAMQWLLPTLLFILLGAGALYFLKGGCNKHQGMDIRDKSVPAAIYPNASTGGTGVINTTNTMGMVDSMGNYVYNLGNMTTLEMPNNAGSLTVGENSTEAKLIHFLQDQNAMVDTVKGNWFEFTNVRFKTGSSVITDESMQQLKNMVLITKAFPAAQFKIGGYTDNSGNEASNVSLSKSRAASVAAKIKELGATEGSIVNSDGYGSQFPIGDNATAEGKAQNRRVSVNVKAK